MNMPEALQHLFPCLMVIDMAVAISVNRPTGVSFKSTPSCFAGTSA